MLACQGQASDPSSAVAALQSHHSPVPPPMLTGGVRGSLRHMCLTHQARGSPASALYAGSFYPWTCHMPPHRSDHIWQFLPGIERKVCTDNNILGIQEGPSAQTQNPWSPSPSSRTLCFLVLKSDAWSEAQTSECRVALDTDTAQPGEPGVWPEGIQGDRGETRALFSEVLSTKSEGLTCPETISGVIPQKVTTQGVPFPD